MKWTVIATMFGAWILSAVLPVGVLAKEATDVHPKRQPLVPEVLRNLPNKTLSQAEKAKLAQEVLDSLFGKLHGVKSPKRAQLLAGAIWKIWARSGSSTADLLLVQAQRAMRAGQERVAVSILSTVIDQYPEFAEAWNKRATVYFIMRDFDRSIADINEVLDREPRHFGALAGLGMIYQQQGKKKKALVAFRRALAIHPHLKSARRAVKRLAGDVEQDI